ncbi:remorin 4.1-like [Malania oleifera]|uniref:remorin 4.1-like n=1 Tax=Malania oleifera TaxID=397392 RepID=UPI0025AE678E|nr:remorin 4.1-like [Malania oleifera]
MFLSIESTIAGIDHGNSSMQFPSVYSENEHSELTARLCDFDASNDLESPINGRYRFMSRPRPYPEFLHEIKRQKLEDQINEWKKTKHKKIMNKLRVKEAAISGWELKQRRMAMKEMKKVESKLEKKRAEALEKMKKKISRAQRKAEQKKAVERKATIKRISTINKISEKIRSAKSSLWLKLIKVILVH